MVARLTNGRTVGPMPPSRAAAGAARAPVRPASGIGDPGPFLAQDHSGSAGGAAPVDHDRRVPWTLPQPTAAPVRYSIPFLAQLIAQGALEAPGRTAVEEQTPAMPETGNRRFETGLRGPGMRKDTFLGVYEATATMAESFVLRRYGSHLDRDGVYVLQAQPIDLTS